MRHLLFVVPYTPNVIRVRQRSHGGHALVVSGGTG
jgi:hypothetical protein